MKPQLLDSLKGYKKSDLLKDLFAGLMVAIIALPLSIALGIQSVPEAVSSHGIQFGIITAIVAGFFISALGGSRFQIGGPTAAFVVIIFSYIMNPKIGLIGLAVASMIAGVILIVMSLLKFGNVMKFFPYPITIGFTTGIGITLLIGQIKDLCGFQSSGAEAIEKVISYFENIKTFSLSTFIVGALGLVCVIGIPKINKKIPSAFVAIIICTLATLLINNCFDGNVATIGSRYGNIKAGFYPIDFSDISSVKFSALIVPSIVIAFLCAIESLLSATVASGMTATTFNPNQELFGQGVANIFSALLGGLPATGAIARTAASIENGAKSPLAGMFHALFVLLLYFALMGIVKFIPLAVFSAILISVAINMSRFKLFFKLSYFGIRDSIILFVTCILTVVFDLTYGVIGGVIVTIIANAKNFKIGMTVENEDGDNEVDVKVEGTIFFFNANRLVEKLQQIFEQADAIVLNLEKVRRVDETALEKLSNLRSKMSASGKILTFIGQNEKTKLRMEKYLGVL